MLTDKELDAADAVCLDIEHYRLLRDICRSLHNLEKAITFDQQRDFAETMRLRLERATTITFPERGI